ncbi:MAG TPA: sugar ABC transporter permease [Microbacterium sp.]|uniref:carbohydrate ABC transporter permease n=1 Tax=Microbacterium sp. UBA1097 TaxID=1946941 RepID=UPI000E9F5170|nr:carbohydrate ABC transporter permease [Microbacterium sp. UBA1097]HAJ18386.1 sugar ABC transporter permease [Microbacterium sp.]HBS09062.1 sugar ABC transporter permease [Microbacterium sp.]HBU43545.1 sugar ABC transporter permease [Microbacterium sp.]
MSTQVTPATQLGTIGIDDEPRGRPRGTRSPRLEGARRPSPRKVVTRTLLNIAAAVVFVMSVFPVYWMVNMSFTPTNEIISRDPSFVPLDFTLENYITAWTREAAPGQTDFPHALGTTVTVTVGVLIVTLLGLGIVYTAAVIPFTIWTLRGFVAGVPADLEEAAMIDGCTKSQAFWKVTFPLLAPGLVATGIFAFIQSWNEFTMALLMMKGYNLTLMPWLNAFQSSSVGGAVNWGAVMAGSTLIALPVVIFFLIVQGRMTGGLVAGAVKG